MRDEQQWRRVQGHDRREIAQGVIRQLLVEGSGDGVGREIGEEQRVPVGRRLGHEVGRDGGAGTRSVLHDHLLAERFRDLGGRRARERVGRPSRRERHHQPDRLYRECLREHARRYQTAQRKHDQSAALLFHGPSSHASLITRHALL